MQFFLVINTRSQHDKSADIDTYIRDATKTPPNATKNVLLWFSVTVLDYARVTRLEYVTCHPQLPIGGDQQKNYYKEELRTMPAFL